MSRERIFGEIAAERDRQDAKWGQQNWPLLGGASGPDPEYLQQVAADHRDDADHWKIINDAGSRTSTLGWDGITLEEVYEAFAETDPHKARAELVQAAAVIVAAIESLDRNELKERA